MVIKKILKFIWQEFIYGGHLQCLGVVSIAYTSSFLLNIKTGWEFLSLIYLIFYPIYINDRFKGIITDELTNPERSKHFRRYSRLIPKIFLFSVLLLLAGLICFANFKFIIFALLTVFFGILYPFYFKNITRKIPFFKNFYVAAFFTIIALSPIIYYSYSLNFSSFISLLMLMTFVFCQTLWMQILLDCKDTENDRLSGLLTFPVLFTKEKSFIFLNLFSIFTTTLVLIPAIFLLKTFPFLFLFLFLIVPFNFYCVYLSKLQKYSGYILASGEFLFLAVLTLINIFLSL